MTLDFHFLLSPIIMVLTSLAAACTLWLLTGYRCRIARLRRYARRQSAAIPAELPPLSVIVYCLDNPDALDRLLNAIFEQNYPGKFEVIVATDGRSSRAEDVVTLQSVKHRNLRMTFVPDEAHALSRKKLAVTLGVKAARFDNVLLTDANVVPSSSDWLALMGRHFADGKQVVIGGCRMVGADGMPERPFAAFNSLVDEVTWLSQAVGGQPYRATDKNMAFSRSLFFANRGFADSVGYQHGIDDIFLSRIANPHNSIVELLPEAVAELRCYDMPTHHLLDKVQHLFTGRDLSHSSRRYFGFGSLTMWIWLLSTLLLAVLALLPVDLSTITGSAPADYAAFDFSRLIPALTAFVLGLVWMIVDAVSWKHAAQVLGMTVKAWRLPWEMHFRPFSNMAYCLRARSTRSQNFSWSKGY